MTTTAHPTTTDRTWLLSLLGPEQYAAVRQELSGPFTAGDLHFIDELLAELNRQYPADGGRSAPDQRLVEITNRVLAAAGAR